jgi:chemotaxis signal transduction protein
MTPATHIQDMHHKTFDFLFFRLGSFLLGVAAEQIIQIRRGNMPQINPDSQRVDLRDIFQMPPDTQMNDSTAVLEVKSRLGRTYVPVDTAEGTIALKLDQIKTLPPLIDCHKSHPALWGLALLDENIAFLLDLDRLKPEMNHKRFTAEQADSSSRRPTSVAK